MEVSRMQPWHDIKENQWTRSDLWLAIQFEVENLFSSFSQVQLYSFSFFLWI